MVHSVEPPVVVLHCADSRHGHCVKDESLVPGRARLEQSCLLVRARCKRTSLWTLEQDISPQLRRGSGSLDDENRELVMTCQTLPFGFPSGLYESTCTLYFSTSYVGLGLALVTQQLIPMLSTLMAPTQYVGPVRILGTALLYCHWPFNPRAVLQVHP